VKARLVLVVATIYEHAARRDGWLWYAVEMNAGRLLYALDPSR
jgi:hypothetical protein